MGNKFSCYVDHGNIVLSQSSGNASQDSTSRIEYTFQPTSKEAVILFSKTFPSLSKEKFVEKELSTINSVATVRDVYPIEDPCNIEPCYFLFLLVSEDMHELKDCNVIYGMMLSKRVLFLVPEKAQKTPNEKSEGSVVPKKDSFDFIKQWFTPERRNFMKVYEHMLQDWNSNPSLLRSAILEKLMHSATERDQNPRGTFMLSLKPHMHLWIADENPDDSSLSRAFCSELELLRSKIEDEFGIKFDTKILQANCVNYISVDNILSVVYVHVHAEQNGMSTTKCRKLLASLLSKCIEAGNPFPYIILSTTDKTCCNDLKMSLSKFNIQWAVVLIPENILSSTKILYETLKESLGIDIENFLQSST
jgi:hypothetical protein